MLHGIMDCTIPSPAAYRNAIPRVGGRVLPALTYDAASTNKARIFAELYEGQNGPALSWFASGYGDRFGQCTRFVNVATQDERSVIRQHLSNRKIHQRCHQGRGVGHDNFIVQIGP